jgi:serine/threonine protein kinase
MAITKLHHVSLGLIYLHSKKIIHGDLKAVSTIVFLSIFINLDEKNIQLNVLIDDAGKAVLCDFGLTRIKADAISQRVHPGSIMGSHNWMAPEQLLGGSPKTSWDIYAFGMTLYEVNLGFIASLALVLIEAL